MTTPEDQAATIAPREYRFDRYRNGELMAEGVTITQAKSVAEAAGKAAMLARKYPPGDVLVLADQAATIAELRERLREAEADQLCPIGMDSNPEYCSAASCRFCRAKRLKEAEARATAAERALVERDAKLGALRVEFDRWCRADQAQDTPALLRFIAEMVSVSIPASSRLAADVLEALGSSHSHFTAGASNQLVTFVFASGDLAEAFNAAVAAWRAGRPEGG